MELFLPWGLDGQSAAITILVIVYLMIWPADTPERRGLLGWYDSHLAACPCTTCHSTTAEQNNPHLNEHESFRNRRFVRRGPAHRVPGMKMNHRVEIDQVEERLELEADCRQGNDRRGKQLRTAAIKAAKDKSIHIDG
jgi:hypothetical protein